MKFLGFEELKSELVKLKKENEELNKKIKYLKQQLIVYDTSASGEDLAKAIIGILNEEEEHKCTPECFEKHVIKAIQNDFDSCSREDKLYFLMYWHDNLLEYYPWLDSLNTIDNKIYFKSKQ